MRTKTTDPWMETYVHC